MTRKEEVWRNEGMNFCLRYLESHNNDVEGLKAEIKRRGAYGIPISISESEENAFCDQVKDACLKSVMLMSLAVLHDIEGYGKVRAKRFVDGLNMAADLLENNLAYWSDYQREVKEQLGIYIELSDKIYQNGIPEKGKR